MGEIIRESTLNNLALECLISPQLDSSLLKQSVTGKAKHKSIEDFEIENDKLVIYYRNGKTSYCSKINLSEDSRNDVDRIRIRTSPDKVYKTILKSYKDPQNSRNEEFWLKFFKGKFGTPRLIDSKKIGNITVKQIEDKGGSFKEFLTSRSGSDPYHKNIAIEAYIQENFEEAIYLYQQMFKYMQKNRRYIEKNAPIKKTIDSEYCMQKFNPFVTDLITLGHEDIAQQLNNKKSYIADIISAHSHYWIHGDYAPRNITHSYKNADMAVIDFETVAKGHPVQDMTSLLYSFENGLQNNTHKDLMRTIFRTLCNVGIEVDTTRKLWQPCRALWNVRQAKGISSAIINGTSNDLNGICQRSEFRWYVDELSKALKSIKQEDIDNFYSTNNKMAVGM
ncbi:MAG: phosphotransferase [Nanoarchaeota archaeon]|nr:phosphotransferase [Nanoarchaeota archaeon]